MKSRHKIRSATQNIEFIIYILSYILNTRFSKYRKENVYVPLNCFSCDGRRNSSSNGNTRTMVFSIKPTDSGVGQIQVFNPTPAVGSATVTWTSITTGNPVARGDAISLYITPELLQVLYILFF